MLSRVAEAIYWAGRYIERAENTARLIRVNSHLMMDTPKGVSLGWDTLITIAGLEDQFREKGHEATERNVVKYLIGTTDNPSSIINSLSYARENCRTIREIIPRSAWQRLNTLHIYAKENINNGLTQKGRDQYLEDIIAGSQQLNGLLSTVMYQDEAWHFLRIGRNIERAEMTTRIVDVQSADLISEDQVINELNSLESVQWISILESLSAYSIYRRIIQVRVSRTPVLNFLFHDPLFPRSVVHCLGSVESSINTLKHNNGALQSLQSLKDSLTKQKMENLKQQELHEFIDEIQLCIWDFHKSLEKQYFLPALQYA